MPRRREVPKREILPDPVYNSQLVTKFINSLMTGGKKSVAESVFYGALKKVEDRAKDDPLKLFKKGVDNVVAVPETGPPFLLTLVTLGENEGHPAMINI